MAISALRSGDPINLCNRNYLDGHTGLVKAEKSEIRGKG